jgi:hypothetical protein
MAKRKNGSLQYGYKIYGELGEVNIGREFEVLAEAEGY